MRRALDLALQGVGRVHPNPMVGAVLARGTRVLSEGYHRRFGGPHAEVEALAGYRQAPADATLYVTLEPCCHTGKTPPCTELILKKKVRRVVAAVRDANPLVSGKGLAALKRAGVRVEEGVLAEEARALNRDFDHWIVTGTPYVTVKAGQSLDGAIATVSGQSKWITSEASRRVAMDIRAHTDAIVVGVRTVLEDDPLLTVRRPGYRGRQPLKIVLDPGLRVPASARIFRSGAPVVLVASQRAPVARRKRLGRLAEVLVMPTAADGAFRWKDLLKELGRRGLVQVLVEGGGETIGRAFDAGVVREAHFFIAPIVLGGQTSRRSVAGRGVRQLSQAARFRQTQVTRLGEDVHVQGVF